MRVFTKLYLMTFLFICTAMACSAQEATPSAQSFWKEFRQAIIANDNQKLAAMTQFPLELRGVVDGIPAKYYTQDQFKSIFLQVLDQPVVTLDGDNIITHTTRDTLISTNTISESDMMTKESFRVDQLSFELKNKRWKLVTVYLEE